MKSSSDSLAAVEVDAAHGDGDHLRAAGFEGARRFLEGFVFSRADDQARAERASGNAVVEPRSTDSRGRLSPQVF
jgi:hypothetical protein